MATATLPRRHVLKEESEIDEIGPRSAGIRMTLKEFDQAEFVDGWRYELINGVLVVSPIPAESEADPNEELGRLLRNYREDHPQGAALNATLPERTVKTKRNRRRADRLIWAGMGRQPRKGEPATIAVEFVSYGKRAWLRDYKDKRDEYLVIGFKEYWVIDRFKRTLTVFTKPGKRIQKRTFAEHETYMSDLLPGFELRLAKLLAIADRWPEEDTYADL